MPSDRGFYKDVGPTGLRSRLPRKIWVMLTQLRRFGTPGEGGGPPGPATFAPPTTKGPQ